MYHSAPPDPTTGLPQSFHMPHVQGLEGIRNLRAGSAMYSTGKGVPTHTAAVNPQTRTLQPIVTGTSVLAMKYNGGVIMAADTLGAYGSLLKFTDVRRLHQVNQTTLLGAGGDISDYQYIQNLLRDVTIEDESHDDGHRLSAPEIHSFLSRVLYNRRSKFDPLWNSLVVAGFENGKSFLGFVDLVGTAFEDNYVVTGMGAHMALPMLRRAHRPDMTYEEAEALFKDCLRVLFYRDCRSINRVQIARVDASGVSIGEPIQLATDWSIAREVSH